MKKILTFTFLVVLLFWITSCLWKSTNESNSNNGNNITKDIKSKEIAVWGISLKKWEKSVSFTDVNDKIQNNLADKKGETTIWDLSDSNTWIEFNN